MPLKLLIYFLFPAFVTFILPACLASKLEKYGSFICQGGLQDTKTDVSCTQICDFKKRYVIRNRTDCMRAKFACEKGQAHFGDCSGCGCVTPIPCQDKDSISGSD